MSDARPREMLPAELAAVLRDMANVVEARDSFEGSIRYEPVENSREPMYAVDGFYRVGNSMGQGGAIIVGGSR